MRLGPSRFVKITLREKTHFDGKGEFFILQKGGVRVSRSNEHGLYQPCPLYTLTGTRQTNTTVPDTLLPPPGTPPVRRPSLPTTSFACCVPCRPRLCAWCLHRNDSNPFLTKRNDSCPIRKRLRPPHPAKFSHERTPLGGLTVTVGRNHY